MGVVALLAFVLHMRRGNRDATRFFFRRFINFIEGHVIGQAFFRQRHRDRRRQGRFAVIHMTDRTDVDMWLIAFKFRLRH